MHGSNPHDPSRRSPGLATISGFPALAVFWMESGSGIRWSARGPGLKLAARANSVSISSGSTYMPIAFRGQSRANQTGFRIRKAMMALKARHLGGSSAVRGLRSPVYVPAPGHGRSVRSAIGARPGTNPGPLPVRYRRAHRRGIARCPSGVERRIASGGGKSGHRGDAKRRRAEVTQASSLLCRSVYPPSARLSFQ